MIAALEKELAVTKAALVLAVALHDRLLEENRALKAPVVFKMAPRSAEQIRLDAGWDKHHA